MRTSSNMIHSLLIFAVVIFAIAAFNGGDGLQTFGDGVAANTRLQGAYSVVRTIDGDTIIVNIAGEDTRIRLIGVDAPENDTAEGQEVTEFVRGILAGSSVYLEYEAPRLDRFGRTRAYVYLNDGTTMLNALLLERGYATVMTLHRNARHSSDFYALEATARQNGVGLWGSGVFE